jgi:hypothetical protein
LQNLKIYYSIYAILKFFFHIHVYHHILIIISKNHLKILIGYRINYKNPFDFFEAKSEFNFKLSEHLINFPPPSITEESDFKNDQKCRYAQKVVNFEFR